MKFFTLLGTICTVLGIICIVIPPASFGVLLFLSLGIGSLLLAMCIKLSKNNGKYKNIFKFIANLGKCIFILWLISFIIIEGFIISGMKSDEGDFDYLIVLGAGISYDRPLASYQVRLDEAFKYLEQNPHTKVILTGGFGEGEEFSESSVGRKYLMEQGIDYNRIFIEEKSRNTYQNILYASEVLGDDFNGTVACVSNDFHLFRARKLLELNGLTPYAFGSPNKDYLALEILYMAREYFSVMKHLLFEV